jgi:hypothetical protein
VNHGVLILKIHYHSIYLLKNMRTDA